MEDTDFARRQHKILRIMMHEMELIMHKKLDDAQKLKEIPESLTEDPSFLAIVTFDETIKDYIKTDSHLPGYVKKADVKKIRDKAW
jgi:hypothetical protein